MVLCFVPDCNNYSHRRHDLSFFRFPDRSTKGSAAENIRRLRIRAKWIKNIGRKDQLPTASSRICSEHFRDGNKDNGPTIFPRSDRKRLEFTSPEKKHRSKRSISSSESDAGAEPESEVAPNEGDSEVANLRLRIVRLEDQLAYQRRVISYHSLNRNDDLVRLYTGLPSAQTFEALSTYLKRFNIAYYLGWTVRELEFEDQLFITLQKLRHNAPLADLAHRTGVSRTTVRNVLWTFVHLLHETLFLNILNSPPSRLKNETCLPSAFANFSNARITLDCTEITCDVPRSMADQRATYSHYKSRNTFKGLVGVAPNGVLTYMSELYSGSTSDKEIVRDCGVLSVLEPGDLVLADKGFLIKDMLPSGVDLNIPPFLTTPQFTPAEAMLTREIARARIHVERAIARIKNYTILDKIPAKFRPISTKLWQVCGALTNLQNPLIKEVM